MSSSGFMPGIFIVLKSVAWMATATAMVGAEILKYPIKQTDI